MAEMRKPENTQSNFNEAMEIAQDAIMSRLNCHNIGRIIEFDTLTQTCTVEMMQIKQFNEQTFIPAPITQVPLIILGAGGGHITMPNPVGTICLLLFLDRNIDNFMETGEQYVPDTARMHDFTDAIALTTFTTLANPIQNYDENAITISYQNANIKVKDEIVINSQGNVTINSPTAITLNAPDVSTTGNFNAGTGYTGVIPCGSATIQVTNGIITGVT